MSNEKSINLNNYEKGKIKKRLINTYNDKKIKRQKFDNTFTSANFYKKQPKNKSHKKFENYRTLPPLMKEKKNKNNLTNRDNSNSIYRTLTLNYDDTDGLFMEILIYHKEIRVINKELKSLKKEYNIIENRNYTNKCLMERILDLYGNGNDQNKKNEGVVIKEEEEYNNDEKNKNNDSEGEKSKNNENNIL